MKEKIQTARKDKKIQERESLMHSPADIERRSYILKRKGVCVRAGGMVYKVRRALAL